MDDKKFLYCTYSTVGFDHKPTPMEYAIRSASLVSDVISPLDLVMLVTEGKSYGNQAVRVTGQPSKFVAGSIISVDLEGSPACALNIAAQENIYLDFGLFAYTTMSHTDEEPRCRLVFATEKPIKDANDYRIIARSLCSAWIDADRGSWEPFRLFLGNPNGTVSWNGSILPEDIYMQLLREAKRREKDKEEELRTRYRESEGKAESFVEYALRTVAGANPGERNNTLNRVAFLAGKHYVKTGKMDKDFISSELLRAALACGLDEREAVRTIKSSIYRGTLV